MQEIEKENLIINNNENANQMGQNGGENKLTN
jgi:hypothetical protein